MNNHTIVRGIVALGIVAPAAGAQQIVPPRPAPVTPPAFTFPGVQSHELPNGLRLLVVEDHSVPVIAVRAVFKVDETFDPPGKEGLYQVMLGSLREGSASRTPEQLAEISAKAGTPVAPTSFTTTPASLASSLELMGEMLMQPVFPQAGVDRRRASQAALVRNRNLAAAVPARNLFYALLDGRDDPVTRAFYANEAGVGTITRDDVVRFYEDNMGPAGTTLIVVGDVTDAKALELVKGVFGGWKKTGPKVTAVAVAPPAPKPTTIHVFDIPGANGTYIYVGSVGPSRNAPDAFAADMVSTIAAERFVSVLREKRSLMYSGGLAVVWKPAPRYSEFLGSTNVAPLKGDTALVEWVTMLRELTTTAPPTAAELANAKASRTGQLWTKTDGPDSTANRIVEATRDNLRPDFLGAYTAAVNALTLQEVQAAAKKYIDVDHLVIVVSGDKKYFEAALRATGIAPVVLVDANGKR